MFIQLIGGLGILCSVISFQCKKGRNILLFRTLNELFFALQYVLLGAYTGTAMNLVGSIRNIIFNKQIQQSKKTTIPIIVFCIFFTGFGIFTWQGPKSILIIFAKVLSTLAYGNKNATVLRLLILITSSCWLVYNLFVFSIAGVFCEAFTLCSLVIGLIRLDFLPWLRKKSAS